MTILRKADDQKFILRGRLLRSIQDLTPRMTPWHNKLVVFNFCPFSWDNERNEQGLPGSGVPASYHPA